MPNATPEPPRVTDGQIEAWERLCEEASEGPWTRAADSNFDEEPHEGSIRCGPPGFYIAKMERDGPNPDVDAEFIAASRTAMPALLAEVRRLKADEARNLEFSLDINRRLATINANLATDSRTPRQTERP